MMFIALSALAALAAAPATPSRTFVADGRKFIGKNASVCDLEGKWKDGQIFIYRAWDVCGKLTFTRIAPSTRDQTVEQVYGADRTFVIPAGAESFMISNGTSVVRIYKDRNDQTQEITIRD